MSHSLEKLVGNTVVTAFDFFPTDCLWCLLKLSNDFPSVHLREDIDILCKNRIEARKIVQCLIQNAPKIIQHKDHSLRETMDANGHIHVDLFSEAGQLLFRFDILSDLPAAYKRFSVSTMYAPNILYNIQWKTRKNRLWPVPCLSDECALRFMEYTEYIHERADKIKHLNYIQNHKECVFRRVSLGEIAYNNWYGDEKLIELPMPRCDSFLVWHLGEQFLNDICSLLRDHPDLKIIDVRKKTFENSNQVRDFVKHVYENDNIPQSHLDAKCAYLLENLTTVAEHKPMNAFLITVENHDPRVTTNGSGQWKVEQSQTIVDVKIQLRGMFNPHFCDLSKKVSPLPQGISHNHVVHASDTQKDAEHLLLLFAENLKLHELCRRVKLGKNVALPYFITAPSIWDTKTVDLHTLRCRIANIINGVIEHTILYLKDTPHYLFASNINRDAYINFHRRCVGVCLTEDHFPEAFDLLKQKFDVQRAQPILCNRDFIIIDGVHRAAILLAMKMKQIDVCVM